MEILAISSTLKPCGSLTKLDAMTNLVAMNKNFWIDRTVYLVPIQDYNNDSQN